MQIAWPIDTLKSYILHEIYFNCTNFCENIFHIFWHLCYTYIFPCGMSTFICQQYSDLRMPNYFSQKWDLIMRILQIFRWNKNLKNFEIFCIAIMQKNYWQMYDKKIVMKNFPIYNKFIDFFEYIWRFSEFFYNFEIIVLEYFSGIYETRYENLEKWFFSERYLYTSDKTKNSNNSKLYFIHPMKVLESRRLCSAIYCGCLLSITPRILVDLLTYRGSVKPASLLPHRVSLMIKELCLEANTMHLLVSKAEELHFEGRRSL